MGVSAGTRSAVAVTTTLMVIPSRVAKSSLSNGSFFNFSSLTFRTCSLAVFEISFRPQLLQELAVSYPFQVLRLDGVCEESQEGSFDLLLEVG